MPTTKRRLERPITTSILKALRERGAWAEKVHGSAYKKSLPDVIACYRGRTIGIEVKRSEHEKATPLQQDTLDQISRAGGACAVVYTVSMALALLDAIDKEEGADVR